MKEKNKKKIKIILKFLSVVLFVFVLFIVFAFAIVYIKLEGNPFVKMRLKKVAEKYISKFGNDSFYVYDVEYNFKRKIYYAEIKSDSSKDRHFEVEISESGEVFGDTTENIHNGENTYSRINEEYKELVKVYEDGKIFSRMEFYQHSYLDRAYDEFDEGQTEKDPHKISIETLEIDKDYDVNLMGKDYGVIKFSFSAEDPDMEFISEILLEIRDIYDKKGVNFYKLNIEINIANSYDRLIINDFLYEDFNNENLLQKIEEKLEWD